jgi:hypothetical protein
MNSEQTVPPSPAAGPALRTVVKSQHDGKWHIAGDICVVGAGIAGISAALEAARLGLNVVLVDGLPALGGQAVNANIGNIAGLFSNGPNPVQLTHGIADDMLRELGAQGAIHYAFSPVVNCVFYDELALGRWIDESVRKAGITAVVGAVLCGVHRHGRRVEEITVATRFGQLRISATGFVDATGDAALTWEAGLPCREPVTPIYGSQMVVLENLREEKNPSYPELWARARAKAEQYGLVRKEGFICFLPGRGIATVNMTHVESPLEPASATLKMFEGRNQADRVFEFLRSEFPECFGNARIRAYGIPGVRQTRWIVGCHQLTAAEVGSAFRFPDSIGRTAWIPEIHDDAAAIDWRPTADDPVHYIPLGCLLPPDADNLAAAGRCADGDAIALSSIRVKGPCIAMGAAAAHALALAGRGSVHEIDIGALQGRLRRNLEDC